MLLEIAIGDAYGAGFEFTDVDFIGAYNNLKYIKHPTRKDKIEAGEYTDDTQMSIALAKFMLSGQAVCQTNIANFFIEEFQRNPIDGYARGFQKLIGSCASGTDLINKIKPFSHRNGAVMRAAPIGLLPSVEEVTQLAIVQASITHASLDGVISALVISLAAHYFYHNLGSKAGISKWLAEAIGNQALVNIKAERGPVPCDAQATANAAIYLVIKHDNLLDILKTAIALGGDTDSVAAVAMGLGSLATEVENNLPKHLQSDLLCYKQLVELDSKLIEKFSKGQVAVKVKKPLIKL